MIYQQWLDDSLEQWNAAYPGNMKKLGSDGPDCIEFGENGDAYPHGIGGTGHVRRAVTPYTG